MRVLFYSTSIRKRAGGITAYLNQLCEALSTQVEMLVVSKPKEDSIILSNVRTELIPSEPIDYFSFRSKFYDILNDFQPDVVHINGVWEPQLWWVQKWARKKGIKVLLSPHGMLEPWLLSRNIWKKKLAMLLYQEKALRKVDYFHATSELELNNLVKLGVKQKIFKVANAVEVEGINLKNNWDKSNTLLFLSRVHPKKGLELLLQSISTLRSENSIVNLIIVGEGDDEYVDSIQALIRTLGLEKQVTLFGGVYGAEKWQLFQKADALVLPTYSENFGIVVGESLVTGTPVITTTGTPWDILNKYACGWCIELNQENLNSAIRNLLAKSSQELEVMGRNGRKLILDNFTGAAIASQMLAVYQTILAEANQS